ncbi:hypothetical protein HJC23_003914 [Cyclotella cryptica]|uniref:Uncharacterized protein n=1 Tax=Cyclotella cryptica TaxID=29204 RepID=A0ABD3PUW8_9STRA|eukprot:CCRYP_011453-RA/>CCRYP_011453-RA protein AED:0.00 eAED:0.00 QI:259/-1/1/1/-1/1/1/512/343
MTALVPHFSLLSVGMFTNGNSTVIEEPRGQLHDCNELLLHPSRSCEDTSSLDDDFSPRGALRKGRPRFNDGETLSVLAVPTTGALPPLHPQLSAASHSPSFSRRCRNLSTDTMTSNGSSVVSVDAGKHGFISHDDVSSTGSLVFAYEQGQEVPPAEYDLPNTILGVFNAAAALGGVENAVSIGYNVESEEEFQKLPYQIRSRLTTLSQTDQEIQSSENQRFSNFSDRMSGYRTMEEGLLDKRRENNNCPSPGNGSTAANTLCYSTETSPFLGGGNPYIHHYPVPEDLHMSMQSTWFSSENLQSLEKSAESNNNPAAVYFSMLLILAIFVGIIYGLFTFMKMLA